MDDQYSDGVDLCMECVDETLTYGRFVHTVSHVLVKTCYNVHDGELVQVVRKARGIAKQVKTSFSHIENAKPAIEDHHVGKTKQAETKKICCSCGKLSATTL
jgi:hypothetical protein